MSAARGDWSTPWEVFRPLADEFGFTVDAAALPHNAKLPRFWTPADDGLVQPTESERVWCNPPWVRGITPQWVKRADEQAAKGALWVMLLPSWTDRQWWHAHVWDAARHRPRPRREIRFIPDRIRFTSRSGQAERAPFGAVVVVFHAGPSDRSAPAQVEMEDVLSLGNKEAA